MNSKKIETLYKMVPGCKRIGYVRDVKTNSELNSLDWNPKSRGIYWSGSQYPCTFEGTFEQAVEFAKLLFRDPRYELSIVV